MASPSTNPVVPVELRDIKPPVPLGNPWVWLWAAPLAALAAVLFWWWLRNRRRLLTPPASILVPAHTRARNALHQALELLSQPEPFCTRVSLILRQYIEDRFQLHAPDRTTEEFLDELQSSPRLTLGQKRTLADFLSRCDLVKFARHQPAETELRDLWETALRFVDETAATVPAEPGTAAPPSNPPTRSSELRAPSSEPR